MYVVLNVEHGDMLHPVEGTAVESRKPENIFSEHVANSEWQEVVLDEDMLKMTNGSRLLLAEDDKK